MTDETAQERSTVNTRPATPIPAAVATWLRVGVVAIVLTAAVGNIGHTYAHVDLSGQHGWYARAMAVTPDVGVLIGVTLLTFRRRSFWGWMIVLASAAFVSWSAFSIAGDKWSDRIVALAPVAFAAIGAGLLESIRGESAELVLAHAEALAEDAERSANARAELAATAAALAQEEAASLAARVAELTDRLAKASDTRTDTDRPPRRTAATVKPQVSADVPAGLSDAETDVLMSMLGQGEMTRADIIRDSRRVESTVKAALRRLSELGYVVSDRRGIYRTVTPGLDGQSKGSVEAEVAGGDR